MVELWREIGVDSHTTVSEREIEGHLRQHPELVEIWHGHSDDQRCSPAWYLARPERGGANDWRVGLQGPRGSIFERQFPDEFTACAFFVARYLESVRRSADPSTVPTFADWLTLSDSDRQQIQSRWNPYGGEGGELVTQIADDFRSRVGTLRGVTVHGIGVYHGGQWVIDVTRPFVFDSRTLPAQHLGIMVHGRLVGEMPVEFGNRRKHEYVWSPPHYEAFVDRCADEIRGELGLPSASRDELLSALAGMPFRDWVELCRQSVREGKLEPFE